MGEAAEASGVRVLLQNRYPLPPKLASETLSRRDSEWGRRVLRVTLNAPHLNVVRIPRSTTPSYSSVEC